MSDVTLSRGRSWVDVGSATVAVEVYEARGLSCVGSCDPYATVEVEHAMQKTQVLKDTTIPKWMETFHFTVVDLPKARGMIKIKARRLAVKDTLLARFILDFNTVALEELQTELILPEALTKEEMDKKQKMKGWSHAELMVKLRVLEDPVRGVTNGKWPEEWNTVIGRENGESKCPSLKLPPSQVPCTDFEVVDHAMDVDRFFNEVNGVAAAPSDQLPPGQGTDNASPDGNGKSLRDEVLGFYAARGIRRSEEEVDQLVAAYASLPPGALMKALAQKYDGSPATAPPPSASSSPPTVAGFVGAPQYRQRLIEFYQAHAPDRLQVINIDNVLQMYLGREEELFATLRERYRAEDQSDLRNPYRSRMKAFYTYYAPEKLHLVTPALRAYKGREEEMFSVLVRKYGQEPNEQQVAEALRYPANQDGSLAPEDSLHFPASDSDAHNPYRRRLEQFYARYCPEKLIHVVKALRLYRGREEHLFAELVSVYGPEPAAAQYQPSYPPTVNVNPQQPTQAVQTTTQMYAPPPPPLSSGPPVRPPDTYRSRLIAFYGRYAPEKLDMVDRALVQYQGKEAELFSQLVAHYGPEPTSPQLSAPYSYGGPVQPSPPAPFAGPAYVVAPPNSQPLLMGYPAASGYGPPPVPPPQPPLYLANYGSY